MTATATAPAPLAAPRRNRRRAAIALLVAVVLAGIGYLFWGSRLLAVDRVEIRGTERLEAAAVEAAAGVPIGTRLISVDAAEVGDRVARLDPVAAVDVQRRWPATLRITVAERTPRATLRLGEGVALYDAEGVEFARVAKAPPGLPELRLDRDGAAETVVADMLVVHAGLPAQLQQQVAALTPKTADDLRFTLKDGTEIRWGSRADSGEKAESLALARAERPKARYYDVSAPNAPAIG